MVIDTNLFSKYQLKVRNKDTRTSSVDINLMSSLLTLDWYFLVGKNKKSK